MPKNADIDFEEFLTTLIGKWIFIILIVAELFYTPITLILKLCGVINWTWYLIFIPYEIDIGGGAIIIIAYLITILFRELTNLIRK